jgi:hypothetical protein
MSPAAGIRKTVKLRQSVHHDLTVYALVAGAAGVSVLALAPASEAEIVYTPANEMIGRDGSYKLDLNHDGIIDFAIFEIPHHTQLRTSQFLTVRGKLGNQVNCASSFCGSEPYAAALMKGNQIGPNLGGHGWITPPTDMAFELSTRQGSYYGFAWANVSDRYLGLKFKINGETHFGWARLNVRLHKGARKDRTWEAQLTGYAYETIAGKAIPAGQTSSDAKDISASPQTAQPRSRLSHAAGTASSGSMSEVFVASQPESELATLGALALGSGGLAIWRRP